MKKVSYVVLDNSSEFIFYIEKSKKFYDIYTNLKTLTLLINNLPKDTRKLVIYNCFMRLNHKTSSYNYNLYSCLVSKDYKLLFFQKQEGFGPRSYSNFHDDVLDYINNTLKIAPNFTQLRDKLYEIEAIVNVSDQMTKDYFKNWLQLNIDNY